MLLSQRDKLPASLSIARSALSALAMRLPTSEEWAWRQVGVELGVLVGQASSLVPAVQTWSGRGNTLREAAVVPAGYVMGWMLGVSFSATGHVVLHGCWIV